jgi:type I restriction enzyme S subunit
MGWEIKKLGEVGSLERGISKHRPRNDPILLGGSYPLIQTGDVANSSTYIRDHSQTYSEAGLNQSRMWSSGTLCITIAANIAKTGILAFDACFPDSVVGFLSNGKVRIEFVHIWMTFLQKILEERAPVSAQRNINLRILSDIDIIVPPIKMQKEFADSVMNIERIAGISMRSGKEMDRLSNILSRMGFEGELVT